jgi:hypothetical protein
MNRGTIKTSTIFIATGGRTSMYRTLEEIPAALRRKLLRSTGGANAGTVLIADRRGAEELMRAQAELLRQGERRSKRAARLRPALRFLTAHWLELLLSGVLGLLLWLLATIRF